MAGADDDAAVDRVGPILDVLGRRVFRTGPLGSGHAMKALNNFCAAAGYAALAEALVLGRSFGLTPSIMVEIVNNSTGRSFCSDVVFPDEVPPPATTPASRSGCSPRTSRSRPGSQRARAPQRPCANSSSSGGRRRRTRSDSPWITRWLIRNGGTSTCPTDVARSLDQSGARRAALARAGSRRVPRHAVLR
jgi:hypothetical protein